MSQAFIRASKHYRPCLLPHVTA